MTSRIEPPPGWSDWELTQYLDTVRSNQFATFHNKKRMMDGLLGIDHCLALLFQNWKDPDPLYPAQFVMRAFATFRVAVSMAMAGQTYETYAMCRATIESVAYGVFIGGREDRFTIWLRRGESPEARRKVRNMFASSGLKAALTNLDPDLKAAYQELYERTIDYGAHPNEAGLLTNIGISDVDGDTHIESIFLQGDGLVLDHALKTVAETGMFILLAAMALYRPRFQALEIIEKVAGLHQHFRAVMKAASLAHATKNDDQENTTTESRPNEDEVG